MNQFFKFYFHVSELLMGSHFGTASTNYKTLDFFFLFCYATRLMGCLFPHRPDLGRELNTDGCIWFSFIPSFSRDEQFAAYFKKVGTFFSFPIRSLVNAISFLQKFLLIYFYSQRILEQK